MAENIAIIVLDFKKINSRLKTACNASTKGPQSPKFKQLIKCLEKSTSQTFCCNVLSDWIVFQGKAFFKDHSI